MSENVVWVTKHCVLYYYIMVNYLQFRLLFLCHIIEVTFLNT